MLPSMKIRFLFGSLILLLVDILWVASSEITEYLYHGLRFDKPFFTAYVKSIMFVIYLAGFFFCDNWWSNYRSLPTRQTVDELFGGDQEEEGRNLTLDQDDDNDDDDEEEDEEEDDDEEEDEEIVVDNSSDEVNKPHKSQPNISINCNPQDMVELVRNEDADSRFQSIPLKTIAPTPSVYIGESIWVPMKRCSDTSSLSGKSSETDDDELNTSGEADVTIETSSNTLSLSSITTNSSYSNGGSRTSGHANIVSFKKKRSKRLSTRHGNSSKKDAAAMSTTLVPNGSGPTKATRGKRRAVRFSKLIEVRQLTDKHADEHFLSRLSYTTFMRVIYNRNHQATQRGTYFGNSTGGATFPGFIFNGGQLGIKDTAMLAFYFTAIWFTANMSFHMGLRYSEAGLVNVLSSTTPLFTLLLGIIFPSGSTTDAISLTKLLGVLMCILSVALLSTTQPLSPESPMAADNSSTSPRSPLLREVNTDTVVPLGSLWSLCGAFFYAVYIVLMRYNVPHDSMLNFPMFFGFIGLFSALIMWPILLLLHFTQFEPFEWPNSDQWCWLLVNGLCGTVVSELLWLLGSFMTSSLVGTIAVSFTIPLAVSFDVFFKQVQYPRLFFLGTIPMFVSFVTIILVSQYDQWDPILGFLERCVRFVKVGPIACVGSDRDSSAGGGGGGGGKKASCTNATNLLIEHEHGDRQQSGGDHIEARDNGGETDSPPITPAANNRRFEGGTSNLPAAPSLSSSTAKLYNFGSGSDEDEDEDGELSRSLIKADGGAGGGGDGVFA